MMNPLNQLPPAFTSVEETALLTLYAKAIESQSVEPILKDEKAEALAACLDPLLQQRTTKMAQQLVNRTIDPRLVVHLALRAKKYDTYTKDFIGKHPNAGVVNAGCGLDTRFFRVDNGKLQFFDLDLPDMIAFKRKILQETERYHMIGQSILDFSWMDQVDSIQQPIIFLFEGLLMYLPEEKVKNLVLTCQKRFPGSEMVCELTNKTWVEGFWGKLAAVKMKQRVKMGSDADFKFGISSPEDLAAWHEGIEFVEQWFYMDDNHPKIGWMRIFKNWKIFRTAQYTARYRLQGALCFH